MQAGPDTVGAARRSGDGHVPVLLDEMLRALDPRAGAVIVDGTYGAGGYARALLSAADCRVWGIDRDGEAIRRGAAQVAEFAPRLRLIHGGFGAMSALLAEQDVREVDGVVLDLGVSSNQLDDTERGFSFRGDGPLDMRMGGDGPSAADVVNSAAEKTLADIIFRFGEERFSRRIARAIVEARGNRPLCTTRALAEVVRAAVPGHAHRAGGRRIDPATRTFQALRIYVNNELEELDRGLAAAESLLRANGTLVVVSFHSLEDRRVKRFLRSRSGANGDTPPSRHLPDLPPGSAPRSSFSIQRRRAIRPSPAEIARNPRARSARLRAARRTDAPAWPMEKAA